MNLLTLSAMRLSSFFLLIFTFTNLFAGPFRDPLLDAIHENNVVVVKDLIRKGVNLNPSNVEMTPLGLAATNARAEIVKILVENGAKVDRANKSGIFPLNFCVRGLGNWYVNERRGDFLWILQYLVDSGADVNTVQSCGYVPLAWAINQPYGCHVSQGCKFDTSFAELLIYNGADLRLTSPVVSREVIEKFKNALNEKYLTNLEGVRYTIKDLGTLESESSIAYGINENSTVCGSYILRDERFYYLCDQTKGLTLIDLPQTARPKKINLRDQVVGNYQTQDGFTHGFVWDSTNGFVDIGTLGGENSWVSDINNSGEIVGSSETGSISVIDCRTKEVHAFAWKKNQITDLGSLAGALGHNGDKSIATAINDRGEIVGFSNTVVLHKGKVIKGDDKAFIIRKRLHDVMEELFPSSKWPSRALDINNAGQVVTVQQTQHDCYKCTIFNLENNQDEEMLNSQGNLADLSRIVINDYGVISLSSNKTLVMRKENQWKVIDLNTAFEGKYWCELKKIFSINNRGYAVGIAKNIYGERHAVLLMPVGSDELTKEALDPLNEFDKPKIEVMLKEAVDGAFAYYTADIEQKVRLRFLEHYSHNQNTAKCVREPYREVLMLEAMEGVVGKIEELSKMLECEKQLWFWDMAESILNAKTTQGRQKLDAFIKIKKAALAHAK